LPFITLGPPLLLVGATAVGFAGIAVDMWTERWVKPRRWFAYPACAFVEAALMTLCFLASMMGLYLLPHERAELPSMAFTWAAGMLLCRATLDRRRWLGRER
jgi:hypothetical protein